MLMDRTLVRVKSSSVISSMMASMESVWLTTARYVHLLHAEGDVDEFQPLDHLSLRRAYPVSCTVDAALTDATRSTRARVDGVKM